MEIRTNIKVYKLELSEDEIGVLKAILGSTLGSGKYQKLAFNMYTSMDEIGVSDDASDCVDEGEITFIRE